MNGLGNPLQVDASSIDVPDPVQPAGKMDHAVRGDHLTRMGEPAEACRDVEGSPAKAALDPDRLARVDPDTDVEWEIGIRSALILEAHLKVDGCPKGLARGTEDGERLVSPHLDDRAAAGPDGVPGDRGESAGQPRRRLVAALLRKPGVAANIGDQEGSDLGLTAEDIVALKLASALRSVKRSVDAPVYRRQIVNSTPEAELDDQRLPPQEATAQPPAPSSVEPLSTSPRRPRRSCRRSTSSTRSS